jgi:peptide/nickel transport system substrate-binding protein
VPSWDPISRQTPLASPIVQCVFDPPLKLSPRLEIQPGVVERYRWLDGSARRLELTFRKDVTFHNGDPLTAGDFKFTYFDRVQEDPSLENAPVWRTALESVDVPSPDKAILHLRRPLPTAPNLLAEMTACVMPKSYFRARGQAGFAAAPVGSGPYKMVDYQRNSRIVLEAHDRYWAGPARIKRIVFQVVPDATARAAAMQAGQADLTINLPIRETQRLNGAPGLAAQMHPSTDIYLVHMVNRPPFTDRNVRLAAHHAIDKAALSRAFFAGQAQPISMLCPPGTRGYSPDFHFAYDPEKAKQLLAASGYSPAKPVKASLFCTNGAFANDFDTARAIVQMWRRVGIQAELQVRSLADFLTLTQGGTLPGAALWRWYTATGTPENYAYILDSRKMFSVWKSADMVERFTALDRETDYDTFVNRYRAIETFAINQGYSVPLLQGISTIVRRQRLKYLPFGNGSLRPYYWSQA